MKVEVGLYDALKSLLNAGPVEVTFTKKDGTERVMKCTTKWSYIPEAKQPIGESTLQENRHVIRAYDIDNDGWRSFRVDSIKSFDIIDGDFNSFNSSSA